MARNKLAFFFCKSQRFNGYFERPTFLIWNNDLNVYFYGSFPWDWSYYNTDLGEYFLRTCMALKVCACSRWDSLFAPCLGQVRAVSANTMKYEINSKKCPLTLWATRVPDMQGGKNVLWLFVCDSSWWVQGLNVCIYFSRKCVQWRILGGNKSKHVAVPGPDLLCIYLYGTQRVKRNDRTVGHKQNTLA